MLGFGIQNKTIIEEEDVDDDHIMNGLTDTINDNINYNKEITRLLKHNNAQEEEQQDEPLDNDHHYLSSAVDLTNINNNSCFYKEESGVYASVDADSNVVDAYFDANYASLDDTIAAFQKQQQQQADINSLLPCSSSSLNMYHHPQHHRRLPSTSTCSSYTSRMMLLDEDMMSSTMAAAMNNAATASTTNTYHDAEDSILMKQALKQAQQRKRRESIGEVVTTRKRPASTSVIPRLTKSSILQTNNNNNSNSSRKRSLSNIHNNNRRKYYSLQQPPSQYERNKLASLEQPPLPSTSPSHNTGNGVHWDPHIDAFEILRAKITGITRSMQEFHVQELFHDEIMGQKKRQQGILTMPSKTTSSPIITTDNRNRNPQKGRRFSLANLYENNSLYLGHRRIRSQSFVPNEKYSDDENKQDDDDDDDETLTRSFNQYRMHQNEEQDQQEESDDESDERLLKSPNLTALFTTTNSLINSRIDELSETASIKSNTSQLEWQKQFLSLVTSCIQQSEALESLSTDVLNAEHRVRELMLVSDTIHEQFHSREKQYEERIRECQQVAHQQLVMIDSLEELTADINMKMESRRREINRQEVLNALDANNTFLQDEELLLQQQQQQQQQQQNERWNFQKSVSDLLNMDDKHDVIQKMRWEIGMFVGGGVGTGHVIHSYQDKLNGIDMMIAGTGTTTAPYRDYQYSDLEQEEEEEQTTTFSISPSIRHIRLYQHQYILHLNSRDRQTRFSLLPKCLWVPDHETNQCQFQQTKRHLRCSTRFSFFQRKHHCRRCGYIVCQRHSANRLPLFNTSKIYSTTGQWSRVCDDCFYDLIMHK